MKAGDYIEYQTRNMKSPAIGEVTGVQAGFDDLCMDIYRGRQFGNHNVSMRNIRLLRVITPVGGPKRDGLM